MKAIGMLSGGLDSALVLKIIQDMGVEVVALKFTSPFYQSNAGPDHAEQVARSLGIELVKIPKGDDFLDVVRHPKHGYGAAVNPCIDCRVYMLKRARKYMEEIGASFIFTGEVIGQRPMSQYRKAMDIVERESGTAGILVRPLSAKLLPPTEPEKNGWIDREKLYGLEGRTRRPQLQLAAQLGVKGFSAPAGGCLMCERPFAARVRDLFKHKADAKMRDIVPLKIGRHYRVGDDKVISGKDRFECKALRAIAKPGDWLFDPVSDKGALVLLQTGARAASPAVAKETGEDACASGSFDFAARLASAYCDGASEFVTISAHQKSGETREVKIRRAARDDFKNWKI